jgi:NADH dehydrogenase
MSERCRLLITGASGYVGRRLVETATRAGHEVLVLGTPPRSRAGLLHLPWRLGETPGLKSFEGATALIHLAYAPIDSTIGKEEVVELNLAGSEALARAALEAGVGRFILASTVSARPDALNRYGRMKYELEQRLTALPHAADRVVSARIGLVYGGEEAGLYGLLSKLVRLTPCLPMIGLDRQVQPIHVDELCAALLAIALGSAADRRDDHAGIFILAGETPIAFADWLRLLRRAHTGRPMRLIPVPLWLALVACDLTRLLPFLPPIDRERVLGLAGTNAVANARDLAALGVTIVDPRQRLHATRGARRQAIAEARSLLSYVSGNRQASIAATARLMRGIARQDVEPLGLPRLILRWPALLRLLDPFRPRTGHRLALRLHLATMVSESETAATLPHRTISALRQILLECLALPFRLALGRRYA